MCLKLLCHIFRIWDVMVPLNCLRVIMVKLPYRQQKLEKVMDQEGLADEEVSKRIAYREILSTTLNNIKPLQCFCEQVSVPDALYKTV